MYARSTTINGRPENIDAGIRFVETEVMPMITELAGCRGLSLLVDRESGRTITTSSWDTEQDMRSSDQSLRPIRERGREMFGGSMEIDEWEIGLMHRSAHGSCCRVTWAEGQDMDRALETFRVGVLPRLEEMSGFCSASVLVNRSTGLACVTVGWESRSAMEATRQSAEELRQRSAGDSDLEIVEVAEFDLALAHLHVPEMA